MQKCTMHAYIQYNSASRMYIHHRTVRIPYVHRIYVGMYVLRSIPVQPSPTRKWVRPLVFPRGCVKPQIGDRPWMRYRPCHARVSLVHLCTAPHRTHRPSALQHTLARAGQISPRAFHIVAPLMSRRAWVSGGAADLLTVGREGRREGGRSLTYGRGGRGRERDRDRDRGRNERCMLCIHTHFISVF